MTFVSIVALLMSLAAMGFAWKGMTSNRLLVLTALLVVHLLASIYYYNYVQKSLADTAFYYFDPYHFANQPFGLSTVLVTKLVHFLKVKFDATYLDCFLVFQSFGFFGIALLLSVFIEIEASIGVALRREYLSLLFLPTLNFWTSGIGKDAPIFFALSLSVWAALQFRKRFLFFCLALGIMVLFRAHIALMAVTALAAAAFFDPLISFGRKVALLSVAFAGIILIVGPTQRTIDLDVTSISSVTTFLTEHSAGGAMVAGTTSVGHASFAVRLLSLLFRPFFFDAAGVLGMITSVENVCIVFVSLDLIAHWKDVAHLARRVFFLRFVMLFALILLISLTLVYYNVGLGLRQRVMAYPMIFSVLVALWSVRRTHVSEPAQRSTRGLMVQGSPNTASPEI